MDVRIATTATLFLVLVQFKLQISDKAPALSYLTLFDKYLIHAAISIFLIFIGSLLVEPLSKLLRVEDDALDGLLGIGVGCLWGVQHWQFFWGARAANAGIQSKVAKMGKIDDSMAALLEKNNIRMRDDGTVRDEARYRKLINN